MKTNCYLMFLCFVSGDDSTKQQTYVILSVYRSFINRWHNLIVIRYLGSLQTSVNKTWSLWHSHSVVYYKISNLIEFNHERIRCKQFFTSNSPVVQLTEQKTADMRMTCWYGSESRGLARLFFVIFLFSTKWIDVTTFWWPLL